MIAAHVIDNRSGITSVKFQSLLLFGQERYDNHLEHFLRNEKGSNKANRIHEIDPTVGIDVGAKTEMYKLMRELVEESDRGVVVVTSDMLELLGLCDRVLVMYRGRIVSEMLGKDITEEKIMRAAVGRAQQAKGNEEKRGGRLRDN